MQHLWTPWRYEYVSGLTEDSCGCVLCDAIADGPSGDEAGLVLFRAEHNFVIINKYPYTSGHVMVAPYEHVADLLDLTPAQRDETLRLAQACESILKESYSPHGFNIGLNIGKAAGAGVIDHLHLHIVPRWLGDASFMSATAETRIVPETPEGTFSRLRPLFDQLEPGSFTEKT